MTPTDPRTVDARAAEAAAHVIPSRWSAIVGSAAHAASGLVGVADGAIAHLGDAAAETRALAAGEAVVVPLARHGGLRLRGPDRIDFLNGQVSHDVRALAVGGALAAMLLDHRGRPQADVTVVRREHELYVAVDDARVARVLASLRAHLVFDQVEIEDQSDVLASLVVSGHDAARALDDALGAPAGTAAAALAAGAEGASVEAPFAGAAVLLHARRRANHPSLDVHVLGRDLGALMAALAAAGFRTVGEIALAAARIEAGIPSSAFEGEEALPQEAGLDDRLSYRKGCYLGQEIMARIEARGSLRRGPVRLSLADAPVDTAERSVLDGDGKAVGRVGTAAWTAASGWQALAVLRLDVPAGAALTTLGTTAVRGGALRAG
jgi:tRNA-modifying protein YgfZ